MLKLVNGFYAIKSLFSKRKSCNICADKQHIAANDFSLHNRTMLQKSTVCGCFYCLKIYSPDEINEWTDSEEDTAICPHCGIDSVLGDASGYDISEESMSEMHGYWFGEGEQP